MITLISPSQAAIDPGLRIISSYLKFNGHEVNIIFLRMRFEKTIQDDIVEEIAQVSGDSLLIGITLMTHEFLLAADLTRKLRKLTKTPIVWGGPHPMTRPLECLGYCDYVCIGEGEYPLLELANRFLKNDKPRNTTGMWCINDSGQIQKNPAMPLVLDLDTLPFPDYTFKNHYTLKENRLAKIETEDDKKGLMGSIYFLYSQRGCPFVCSYCINHFFLKQHRGKFHRNRSIDNIMEELRMAKRNFAFIKSVCLDSDDFLSMDLCDIERFASLYKDEINLPFHVNATPKNLTEDKIKILATSGLNDVSMGIQTGSKRTLRLYRRATSVDEILGATRILNKFHPHITANYDFILDNPWESDDDLIESLRLLNEIPRPYKILLYSLTLYPGTELYERAKKENLIRDEIREIYTKSYHTDISSNYFNGLFYLYATLPVPKRLGLFLTNKRVIYHPLFFGVRFLITHSTPFLKGIHFIKFLALAVAEGNVGLLKNYFKVLVREIAKIFGAR